MTTSLRRGTRVRPRPGSRTAQMVGKDAAGNDTAGIVDAVGQGDDGMEHVWVMLDGGGYVQGETATEWDAIDG